MSMLKYSLDKIILAYSRGKVQGLISCDMRCNSGEVHKYSISSGCSYFAAFIIFPRREYYEEIRNSCKRAWGTRKSP